MSAIKALDNLRTAARNMAKGRNLKNHEECNLLLIIADEIEAETAEMQAFCERVEKAAKAREELEVFGTAYMPLPLDADGVPIRVGDEIECHANGYDGAFTVFAIGNGVVVGDHDIEWIARNPSNWFHVTSFCTHAKPRTLEDVLRDYACGFADSSGPGYDEEVTKRYAEEIRELLGVDDD